MPTGKDKFSKAKRSEIMRAVRQRGTAPERAVAAILRELGAHYRLNHPGLPGRPDFANRARGWAIFVHGCFWHGHRNCRRSRASRVPVSNVQFWAAKIDRNRKRDTRVTRRLREMGVRVLTVWECELRDPAGLRRRLVRFFVG